MTARAPKPAGASRLGGAQLFLNAAGRVDRLTFALAMAPVALLAASPGLAPAGWPRTGVAVLAWPVAFVTGCVLLAKRLHDFGAAGWWTAPVLALAWVRLHMAWSGGVLELMGDLVCAATGALLALRPGARGLNRFGPQPRGSGPEGPQ